MGNFDQKVNKFIEIFVEQNGYAKVIQVVKLYFCHALSLLFDSYRHFVC